MSTCACILPFAPGPATPPREQARDEEIANAASHALACLLPLLAWPMLSAPPSASPARWASSRWPCSASPW